MKMLRPIFACALFALSLSAAAAAGLPPLPGANKDAPKASAPGEGGGALEPYLVTWLLPVTGIIMAASGLVVDRRMRAKGGGGKLHA
jgi:hypothetical protein